MGTWPISSISSKSESPDGLILQFMKAAIHSLEFSCNWFHILKHIEDHLKVVIKYQKAVCCGFNLLESLQKHLKELVRLFRVSDLFSLDFQTVLRCANVCFKITRIFTIP